MGPDPTRPEHTFDPQYIRGQLGLDQGTFWPDPMRFFWPNGQKIGKFGIFCWNFPNPNQRWLTRVKNFNPDSSLLLILFLVIIRMMVLWNFDLSIILVQCMPFNNLSRATNTLKLICFQKIWKESHSSQERMMLRILFH